MKILFDHDLFYNIYGGASKYFVKLIANLPLGSWATTALFPLNEYARAEGLMKTYKQSFRGQIRLTTWLNRYYTRYKLRTASYDVYHQTNFATYCLKDLRQKPMVTTFHDINLSTYLPQPNMVERQKISLERADAIVCVSENTKNDMLRIFDQIDENKVHVIYHGIDIPDLSKVNARRIFPFPYILYVGARLEYKNFSRFIRAFSLIHSQYPEIKVVCTSYQFSEDEVNQFHSLGIENSMVHMSATEEDMLRLYRDALFFIYPSLYEGFGMPILEAWACHCPVTLSNASCFPEIAKDGGLYFEATSIDDMSEKMQNLINSEEERRTLVSRGDALVKEYSWKKCAQEHMKVYERLV